MHSLHFYSSFRLLAGYITFSKHSYLKGGRHRDRDMAETEIHEKLSRILVRYEGGRIEPLEFRWGTRDLRVASVNAHWVDRATRPIKYFFSVTTSSGEV